MSVAHVLVFSLTRLKISVMVNGRLKEKYRVKASSSSPSGMSRRLPKVKIARCRQ